MSSMITIAVQQSGSRMAQVGLYARTAWTLMNAAIAVVAGISTLNMVVANVGLATLNETASPLIQQLGRAEQ